MEGLAENWQAELTLAGCEYCDWIYVLAPSQLPLQCPHCARLELTVLDQAADRPVYINSPELMLPFKITEQQIRQKLAAFAKNAILAPYDLKGDRLISRLRALYLPMWLVDADVQAQWQAEMGFDYQVVSHKESFSNNRWQTREVKETRKRWEPRAGSLQRHYENRHAPALEEQSEIETRLGQFRLSEARPYAAEDLAGILVRLPNRPPEDAWPEAKVAIQQAAAEECRQAASADHIRRYRWSPEFENTHWTQLLYPIYTSYYLDDENRPQMLYFHGQTGKLLGQRRASMQKAQKWSLGIGIAAIGLFVLTLLAFLLGLAYSQALVIAGIGFVLGMLTGITALIPVLVTWIINRRAADNRPL